MSKSGVPDDVPSFASDSDSGGTDVEQSSSDDETKSSDDEDDDDTFSTPLSFT